MNLMHRPRSDGTDPNAEPARTDGLPPQRATTPVPSRGRTSLDRANQSWLGFGIAIVVVLALSVFMLQNTGTAEYSFLWMHGSLPVAMILLIAVAGGFLLAQLRTLIGRRH